MNFLGKLLEILDTKMQVPEMYGWFHISFFALSVIAGILLCRIFKNPDERFVKRLLLISSLIVLVLEIYKQINYTFSFDGTAISADYQWYAFPFQFCSTPMYIGFVALLKNKRLHRACCAYLATFALFAGLCVMVYPPQVFVSTIGINVQSMICHGMMISIGIYLFGSGYVETKHRTILKAVPVFAVCVLVAAVMNEIAYLSGLLERETFNMFFISPHCEPSLPVYSLVQEVVPFPWCAIIYIVAFSVAAYIILLLAMIIKRFANTKKRQERNI
ncbi:MAG: YwaF family protein [Clostridia bacterium]|nr:YwaF family protein [Clostridia bacterium]